MNSKEEINTLKGIRTPDSSELSSDISDEKFELTIYEKSSSPVQKDVFYNEELIPSDLRIKKSPRFFTEDDENNFSNLKSPKRKSVNELKIKKICEQLKNIAKDELLYDKKRKFTFS